MHYKRVRTLNLLSCILFYLVFINLVLCFFSLYYFLFILEIPGVIPFTVIHNTSTKFKSQTRNVFIPGEEVHVKIIDNERSVTTHPLNPNLYTIEFRHGPFVWTIKKRYKHIQYLHNQLKIYRASLNIPFPTKSHRERRNSLKSLRTVDEKKGRRNALPRYKTYTLLSIFTVKKLEKYNQNITFTGFLINLTFWCLTSS